MKKLLLMMLGVLIALPTFARDFRYEYKGEKLWYTVLSETDRTVMTRSGSGFIPPNTQPSAGNKVSGNLVLPEKVYEGEVEYTLVCIGDYAFSGCTGLTSVTIPNSVTSIGDEAFKYCSGLTKAEFASIESLCTIKFQANTSNPLLYAHNLYIDGKVITDVEIPNSVTSIGNCAFYGCSGLTSVTIPDSVISIGYSAFKDCTGLTSVTIPNSVSKIDVWTFMGCTGLTSVTIPNSVTEIVAWAFDGCTGLTSVTIPNSVTSI